MNFDEFTGEVQHRLSLPDTGEAVTASRAVLATLGERLPEGEATDLAGPLPREIDRFLLEVEHGQRFDADEFVDRVAGRAGSVADDEGEAAFFVRALFDLLASTVPGGEFRQVRNALPAGDDWDGLFELVDAEETPWDVPEAGEGGPAS